MKNKIFAAIVILITICSCNKEDSNIRLELTPKKLVIGKWYAFNPAIWDFEITTSTINYLNGGSKDVININDTAIFYKTPGVYPGYSHWYYELSSNGDTVIFNRNPTFQSFKRFK